MHPVLFSLFGYPVHTYAVAIALGFVAGIWHAARYGERVGLDRDMILDLCWWLIVSGLVGSRIAFIIVEWDQYYLPCVDMAQFNLLYPDKAITEPDCTRLLRFWNGGLVFYGGVIGALLTLVWFVRREGVSVWPIADALIPSLGLGQFFGRLGCHAAGCCWGAPFDSAWGVEFPRRSMPWAAHVEEGLIEATAQHSATIHAVQLYDALVGLGLFALLVWLRQRKRYHGQVFIYWMFLYPLARGTIELVRGDAERGFLTEITVPWINNLLGYPANTVNFLSTSQFISLGMMSVAVVLLVVNRRRRNAGGSAGSPGPISPDAPAAG
ncbi:MAG: prolipoprotein diacylglyceryl transferase [Myxococcales bacterium]|nr:prolipoprotein diacylglyceryl transferase [Myxococcales bacterium]